MWKSFVNFAKFGQILLMVIDKNDKKYYNIGSAKWRTKYKKFNGGFTYEDE